MVVKSALITILPARLPLGTLTLEFHFQVVCLRASALAKILFPILPKGTTPAVFAQSNHIHPYEIETLRKTANFTLGTYVDGKKLRMANTAD